MTGKPRSPSQLKRDLARESKMYLHGASQEEIAAELGLNQATVSRDLATLQGEWAQLALRNLDQRKAEELARLDTIERAAWQAWERSCENATIETKRVKGKNSIDGSRLRADEMEQITRTEGRTGDPRYLQVIHDCIKRRCEILGIDAPKKDSGFGDITLNVVRQESRPADEPGPDAPPPRSAPRRGAGAQAPGSKIRPAAGEKRKPAAKPMELPPTDRAPTDPQPA